MTIHRENRGNNRIKADQQSDQKQKKMIYQNRDNNTIKADQKSDKKRKKKNNAPKSQ